MIVERLVWSQSTDKIAFARFCELLRPLFGCTKIGNGCAKIGNEEADFCA